MLGFILEGGTVEPAGRQPRHLGGNPWARKTPCMRPVGSSPAL